jgi:hypothetical protein
VVAQEREAFGIEFIDTAGAGAAIAHEAGVLENAQVLGNGRTGDGESGSEFVNGARMGAEKLNDGPAGGVAESGEAVLYVSSHLR